MARYALAHHVFLCVSGEHLVLLDLKADRYWALEASQTAGLASLISGWPIRDEEPARAAGAPSPQTAAALEVLQSRGLLADGIPPGKPAVPVTAVMPRRELISDTDMLAGAREGSRVALFVGSAFAKLALRTWAFERVIRRVRHRKERVRAGMGALDVERARRLVESYLRYRIFLFSSRNECLYDSLALLEFLARCGVYPDWVFGVQTRPFAAHCWVQHGDIVFNDTVEHVSGYSPIMVV